MLFDARATVLHSRMAQTRPRSELFGAAVRSIALRFGSRSLNAFSRSTLPTGSHQGISCDDAGDDGLMPRARQVGSVRQRGRGTAVSKKRGRRLWEQKQLKPDRERMEGVREGLLREFAADGVILVDFVVALSEPFYFTVWLGVPTDRERDVGQQDATVDGRVRRVVAEHAMTELYRGFTIESQETVDRDYEGRWFYRRR